MKFRIKKNNDEHYFQCVFISKLRNKGVFCFAVPNGGLRNKLTAIKLKREGVMAGVSDIIVLHNKKTYFVEVKAPTTYTISAKTGKRIVLKSGGPQSDSQKVFQNCVESMGFEYRIINNAETMNKFIKDIIK